MRITTMQKALLPAACALMLLSGQASAQGRIHNLKAIEGETPFNGFIVKFKEGSAAKADVSSASAALNAATARLGKGRAVDLSAQRNPQRPFSIDHVRRLGAGSNLVRPSRQLSRGEAVAVIREIANDPSVEYVEPNLIFQHQLTPNDPLFADQWGYGAAGIRAESAWNLSSGSGVTVAVLDTGITSHPDLNANVLAGYDFVTPVDRGNDGNGRDSDASDPGDVCAASGRFSSSWHGTHVSGTVAALTNNSTGVSGTAFGAKIMPVRVLGVCGGELADIADAIIWSSGGSVPGVTTLTPSAAAKVINLSLGGAHECPVTYQEAITGAIGRGTTVVAAAGNANMDAANYSPAGCPGVIAVAAVDVNGNKASFSNHGPRVDLAGPGVGVTSTINTGVNGPVAPSYTSYNGTSMAAPHVAGIVALIQGRRLAAGLPLMAPADIKLLLKGTARPLAGACPQGCGTGMADAGEAVAAALVNSLPVGSQTDLSGKITVTVFERTAATAAGQFTDFAVQVPEDYVVIGGGIQGGDSAQGHLLTASYPNAARSAWLVSSKEHLETRPVQITAWAVGLKVTGLSRAELLSHMTYRTSTSAYAQQPAVAVPMAPGYTQIGGGFQVTAAAPGNLAWASYPTTATGNVPAWSSASKDHGTTSPATIRSFSIGLRTNLPGVGVVSGTVIASPASASSASPSASIAMTQGYALTSCGAKVNWTGSGNLLWKIKPLGGAQAACEVGSRQHLYSSPATVEAFAVGIKVN